MKKTLVAVIVALASVSLPVTAAHAGHYTRPDADPQEPKWFVHALPQMVDYYLCQLSHR